MTPSRELLIRPITSFATRCNLAKVGRWSDVAEALENAKRDPIVPVEPCIKILDDNRVLRSFGSRLWV